MAKSKGQTSLKPKRYVTGGEIEAIYQDLFERSPDKNGLDYWIEQLKGKTAAEAYDIIGKSATGNDAKEVSAAEIREKAVIAAYREQLGREADATGLRDYIAKLEQGSSINDINQSLNRSLEGQNYDTQLLTSGYRQMFERNPEQEGFQYWFSRMQTDPGLAERALKDYLEGGAQNTDIAKAAQAVAEGYYTNIISPDLEADPYGGRGLTQSIYDVPADAANLSYIDGQAVQFAAPVTQGTVRSTFTTGIPEAPGYTATAGENILQSGAVAAAAARALNSGAMSADEFRTLQTELRSAGNDVSKIFTALNKPQAHVVLDELYGFQLGAGNTLADAQARAKEIQGVLDSLGTPYAPSNFMVADRARELNVPYAFGKEAFTGYNTQATQADIINQANAEVKAREAINALEGALVKTQRPQYGQVEFAQQPAGLGALKPFQTFADRPLLGGSAPGAAVVPGMAAPTPYTGVPATPARPAINLSPQYQGAQDVAALIAASQGYVAPRTLVLPTNVPSGIVPYNPPTPGTTVRVPEAPPDTNTTSGPPATLNFVPAREGGYIGMADGGIASLAKKVQDKGRGDDTMLVHMTPDEVAGLQALAMQMGGSGTINPETGLPEFGWLDRTFKRIIKPIAKVAQFVIPFIPGIGLPMAAALSGIAGGFAGGKGGKTFDFKRALVSGITSYGLGSLARSAAAAGEAAKTAAIDPLADVYSGGSDIFGAASAPATPPSDMAFDRLGDVYGGGGPQFFAPPPAELPPITAVPTTPTAPAPTTSRGFITDLPEGSGFTDYAKATGQNIKSSITGAPKLLSSDKAIQTAAQEAGGVNPFTDKPLTPMTAGTVALTGVSTTEGMDKQAAAKIAQEDEEERMRNLAYGIMSRYPLQYAEGGPVTDELGYDMAAGGLKEGSFVVPADVVAHLGNGSTDAGLKMLAKKYGASPIKGDGDGMSDSIPTTIAGRQPARVADGEAVIPPEVVKKVGPKKLYAMMDKVRQARTGTTKQGKEINPMRYMPA
jgi:hypothetical protein